VEKDSAQIARNEKLSPLLHTKNKTNGMLIIADGNNWLCAVYKFDEYVMILYKFASVFSHFGDPLWLASRLSIVIQSHNYQK
jgi:hypothetical protein